MSPDTNPGTRAETGLDTKPAANSDTNPFSIPIGTSDPINLCEGLPLIPRLGTARAGATGAARSEKLFDIGITILFTRINASSYYSWGFGVCGPAIGFLSPNVDVLRDNVGNRGRMTLTFNEGLEMQAGLFVGAFAGIGLTLHVQLYLPRPWWRVWSFAWQDAFAINVGYTIDLLSLLVQLIQHMLSRNSKASFAVDNANRLRDALPDLRQTFAMVDSAGSRNTVDEVLTATPQLTLPFNLVNYFPPLKALNDGLAKIAGEISVGPSLLIQFPVDFRFTKFTVEGGLEGRGQNDSADYGGIDYNGKVLTATGPTRFEPGVKPSKVTSHVHYESRFALGLSVHFKVSVAKLFNVEVNSASLDLSNVLFGVRRHLTIPVDTTVSTGVAGSCVLTPNMTLAFATANGSGANFTTGQRLRGTVRLPGFSSDQDKQVKVEIEPPVAGFPSSVTIPARGNTASFEYTFQNQCLSTGNPNSPSEVAAPSPVTPLETYTVSARLPTDEVTNGCTDYHVQVPLNISERYIRCQRIPGLSVAGTSPPWDTAKLAGVTLHADAAPGQTRELKLAAFSLWFPYDPSENPAPVSLTFTLLNENRQPHATSNVTVSVDSGTVTLRPTARGTRTPGRAYSDSRVFFLGWNSKGRSTGYSNRFYLVVDAGCRFGQTEIWLDVWNWS